MSDKEQKSSEKQNMEKCFFTPVRHKKSSKSENREHFTFSSGDQPHHRINMKDEERKRKKRREKNAEIFFLQMLPAFSSLRLAEKKHQLDLAAVWGSLIEEEEKSELFLINFSFFANRT